MYAKSSTAIALYPAPSWRQVRRMVPLSLIILAHLGFFYALQSGLLRQAGQAAQITMPKEIIASFITNENVPEPKQPIPQKQAAPPPVLKKTVPPIPVKQIQQQPPSEKAIIAPPVAQQASLPEQPAAVTAPSASTVSAAPAVSTQLKTITSGVEYIRAPEPEYPRIAKRLGEEGRVIWRVLVNEKGRTERVELQQSSGSARLDEAARQALMSTLFKPHSEGGRAVAVFAIVPITFHLDK